MNRRVLRKAGPVKLKVVDGLAHRAAIEIADEVERNRDSASDEWRESDTTAGGGILLRDRDSAELAHPPALADHDTESFSVSRVGEP